MQHLTVNLGIRLKRFFLYPTVSLFPHLFLTTTLWIMAEYYEEYLSPKVNPRTFDYLILILLITPVFSWLLHHYCETRKNKNFVLNGVNFKILTFFATSIILSSIDEVSDIISIWDYFR